MRLILALLVLPLLLPVAARAQTGPETVTPVVVELFTSQGCSSCPPADALLARLAEREGVIALALHVDYWDYLGWADSWGKPKHTARQRGYAKAAGHRSIFTPEMVVQGEKHLKGHDAGRIIEKIEGCQDEPRRAEVRLERDGDALDIRVAPLAANLGMAEVHLVRFKPEEQVSIEAGENAGRDLLYTNIVTAWDTIARWDGTAPLDIRHEATGDGPLAVIVQSSHFGPILAAAELR
jgi:hypothetical protein